MRRYFHTCYLSGAQFAQGAVAKARRQGLLADPRMLPCTDCRSAASEYDHRDYNKPLQVEPVCRGCNARRGRALPKQWRPGEWQAYIDRVAKATWTRRHVLHLYDRFKHELPPVFATDPEQGRAAA